MNTETREKLKVLQARAKAMTLFGGLKPNRALQDELIETLTATLSAEHKDLVESESELGKLYKKAHFGDLDARQELRGLVIEVTTNYITATMNFGSFFETRTLADSESPVVVNTTRHQEIKASYIGQDGSNEITKILKPRHEYTIDLHELVSEEAEYRTRDLYTGDISEAARVMFDISFDLKQKLETILFNLLTDPSVGAFGNFDLTNANKAKRTFNTHSRIASGVLPTTNELDISGVGAGTKFGFGVLDEAIDYNLRFTNTEASGDVRPTGDMIVPAQDIREILTGVTPTNAKQNAIAEELMATGWMSVSYGGVNWKFIPDNTIGRKKCYVKLSKPVGILWFKPGMADMEEKVDRKTNLASRWEKIVIASTITTPAKKNILRIRYRT